MKALLYDDNNKVVAYSLIDPVNMYPGDTLTIKWNLTFNNHSICDYCGKVMAHEKDERILQMTEVKGNYYYLCGLRCKILTSLKQALA